TGDRADGGGSTTHSVPGRRAGLRDGRSPRLRPVGGTTRGEWLASVGRLSGAVGRGRIDKVVLARRLDLEADRPIDVAAALRRLAHGAPESTVFAVSRAGRTFLGATPERLVRLERGEVRTVALAGSIGRGATAAEDDALARALLASEKDREEHAVVVAMLREALEPLTAALVVEPRPSVVRLRHVQHLATGLRGVLREPLGVLDLVARLHPTPAVGGWPRELALELLAEEERIDRGWYAGPLGWVDRSGDGELVVAIRSAVVEGRRASLFAGCGIVADSDPELEWAESEMKLRAVASALGEIAR
ncbi:MAG TPA: isochorismate synthase, partial [Candidatus Limnocylindrales bacterium]|nr:isochorismate synthase [Candidatus Limnocylindrales bacterium]